MKAIDETAIIPLSKSSRADAKPGSVRYKTTTIRLASHTDDSRRLDDVLPKMTSTKQAYQVQTQSQSPELYEGSIDANLLSAEQLHRSLRTNRRKTAARRNLLGSIYTKHNDVQRSYSFVAGERPQVEVRFPKVYFSDSLPTNGNKPLSVGQPSLSRSSRRSVDVSSTSAGAINRSPTSVASNKASVQRARSHKLSLPEIIMEFNMEANLGTTDARRSHVISPTDDDDDEREFAAPYEDFLNKPVSTMNNPCRSKYRPVTPGLLESLNKLKVPSKIRTEQWIKSSQNSKKSYCGTTYKNGNLDNANLAFPNWIYTDS